MKPHISDTSLRIYRLELSRVLRLLTLWTVLIDAHSYSKKKKIARYYINTYNIDT